MSDRKYDNMIPPTITEQPRRPHPVELVIMATGAASFLALCIAALTDRPWVEMWRWLIVGAMLPVGVFLLATLGPIIVWALETIASRDVTGDGVIGKPHPVLVNPRQGQEVAKRQSEAEYRAAFEVFIRGCERDTSLRRWEDRGVNRAQYQEWRDTLMGAGYAAWKNDTDQRQGWRLLLPAEQIVEEIWRA
jgi:hypothetical protein